VQNFVLERSFKKFLKGQLINQGKIKMLFDLEDLPHHSNNDEYQGFE